jgi:hypothetical protein
VIGGPTGASGASSPGGRASEGRSRRSRGATLAAGLAVVAVAGATGAAGASDFVLTSRTIGQGYAERRYGAGGASELLTRRRLTQYLSLSAFNIEPEAWRGKDGDRNLVSVEIGMRFDSDFGTFLTGRPNGLDTIRELAQSQFDVLYAYLLARDVAGHVDVQLGRQLHYDLVDFYSFDGADVWLRPGPFVSVQAFGGTEVRGELPLSAPLYELDGTSPGSRDPATRPGQSSAWRPLVGAAVALDRSSPVNARIAYRKVFSQTIDRQPGEPDSGVNHETVSFTGDTRWRDRLFLSVGARYNLLVAGWDDQQAAVRIRLGLRHMLSAEYSFLAPTFDGDSIWNIFGAGAYRDWRASYDLQVTPAWRAHLRGFLRQFVEAPGVPTELSDAAPGGRRANGASVGFDVRGVRGRARADAYVETGFGGWKVGGDASGRWVLRPNLFDVEGRLTAMAWRPDNVPQPRDAVMVGAALGCVYHLGNKMRVHFLGEDNMGTYYRAQVRGLGVLEMDVTL